MVVESASQGFEYYQTTGKVSVSGGGFQVRYLHDVRSSYGQLEMRIQRHLNSMGSIFRSFTRNWKIRGETTGVKS